MESLRDDTRPAVTAALRHGRDADRRGDDIHFILALLYCFTLPLAPAPNSIAFALLLVFALIRLPHTWRAYPMLMRAPYTWGVLLWTAYFALSMAWSPDPLQGLDELGAMRALLVPFVIWPVVDRARLLIVAALFGVLAQNAAQLGQLAGVLSRDTHSAPGRVGGLLHPIQTGTWCVAAMTWYIAALMTTRGRRRFAWMAGLIVAAAGLVATGSRGPMIGGAVALPLTVIVIAVRMPAARRMAILLAVLGAIGAVAARPLVQPRVTQAVTELRHARETGDYWSSDARRLGLWTWAVDLARESPVLGAGAGAYRASVPELPSYRRAVERCHESALEELEGYAEAVAEDRPLKSLPRYKRALRIGQNREDEMLEGHAHSIYLHTLACQGIVGAAIGVFLLGAAVFSCATDPRDHPYAAGSTFVLIGWLVGAQFDCHHLNGQLLGLFSLLAAVTLPHRPGRLDDDEMHAMGDRWDALAQRDPMHYVATRAEPWTEDAFYATGAEVVERVLGWIGPAAPRRRMAEIGCGLGRTAVHFARHFDRVDGVDVSAEMIERARRGPLPDHVHLHVGEGADLRPLEDRSCDMVFSTLVFQHIPDDGAIAGYLAETARVLTDEGRAVLQFDTRPRRRLLDLYKSLPDWLLPRHHRRYIRRYRRDAHGVRVLIRSAGLAVVEEHEPASAEHYFVLERDAT